jgi:predicted O-methyltransferase YrrM
VFIDELFFEMYQARGWHATPVHFYQPIPDTRELPDRLWEGQSEMVGIECNLERQVAMLDDEWGRFLEEYHRDVNQFALPPKEAGPAGGFGGMDGAMLFAMIRSNRPRRIVEIGSGHSTLVAIEALKRNAADGQSPAGRITAIEPYPSAFLGPALANCGDLIRVKVEDVALDTFDVLEAGDILFIDSSHTVRIGGDVIHEILEIVPRVKPVVLIHFHDIFLPRHYSKEWVKQRHLFWAEQYMLQAFLAFNREFEIVWSAGLMHARQPDKLAGHFANFDPARQDAGSLWIRRRTQT